VPVTGKPFYSSLLFVNGLDLMKVAKSIRLLALLANIIQVFKVCHMETAELICDHQ